MAEIAQTDPRAVKALSVINSRLNGAEAEIAKWKAKVATANSEDGTLDYVLSWSDAIYANSAEATVLRRFLAMFSSLPYDEAHAMLVQEAMDAARRVSRSTSASTNMLHMCSVAAHSELVTALRWVR